jgi:flagellin-like protein
MRTKSRKALSPVVATIILIAVTVAVGLAVAAWMGALTFSYMGTESINITSVSFTGTSGANNNNITITMKNTGTKTVTLGQVKLNSVNWWANVTGTTVLTAGASGKTLTIMNVGWTNGNPYKIDLFDATGTGVGSIQINAPGT